MPTIARRQFRIGIGAALIACMFIIPVYGAINPSEVLVVYNSQSSGATTVKDSYLAAHPTIPAANVFNLNDATIAGVPDVSYTDFINKIRNPIRTYLDVAGGPSATSIISIVLIRGIPHRIYDTDNALAGDNPASLNSEFGAGDATCASVDAELTLLWQNIELGTTGFPEAGGTMDSKSDNLIDNPYHESSTSINNLATYPRTNIKTQKTLVNIGNLVWQSIASGPTSGKLTPGDMYLVCRIDGTTVADAQAIITRGANLLVNRKYAWIILDEDARANPFDDDDLGGLFGSAPDYETTRDTMQTAGWHVRYDNTTDFIESVEETRPVIAYASLGQNHSPQPPGAAGTYINGFHFPRGAIFNTIESYNGRSFNGLGAFFITQEQVADFITAGGTFGVGNVWEPFSFSLADNRYLVVNLLVNGMTWAEAAWSAIPALSWMQIAVGDPLAKVMTVVDQTADFDADGDVDTDDLDYFKLCDTRASIPQTDPSCAEAHLDGDSDVDMDDFAKFQKCFSGADVIANPACYP